MHFLPDIYVPCEVCHGARYNRDTLEVTFRGKTIADVLDLSCEEALGFFAAQPPIARHLQTLVDVGLGYIRLGQSAPTLSGGEAQRVKLATELSRRSTGTTLYVLDEPTTGLHFDDVRKLLDVLNRLVDQGNTVIVIEHNLDVIKTADWIIDMGPEGGDRGGTVVAEGSPEHVAGVAASYTGQVLAPLLGVLPGIAAPPARSGNGTDPKKPTAKKKPIATKAAAKKKAAATAASTVGRVKKTTDGTAKKSPATKPAAKKSPARKATASR
jgi:excinuclease ABC subunit A